MYFEFQATGTGPLLYLASGFFLGVVACYLFLSEAYNKDRRRFKKAEKEFLEATEMLRRFKFHEDEDEQE